MLLVMGPGYWHFKKILDVGIFNLKFIAMYYYVIYASILSVTPHQDTRLGTVTQQMGAELSNLNTFGLPNCFTLL